MSIKTQHTPPQMVPIEKALIFTAWQLIGWEGDCGKIARANIAARKSYTDVMYNDATAGRAGNVKLARLDIGPRERCQWVKAEERLKIISMTERGQAFLREQGLIPTAGGTP